MFTIIIAGAIVMEIVICIQRVSHSRERGEDCIYIEEKHGLFTPVLPEYLVFALLRPQIPDKERIHPLYSSRIILLLLDENSDR